MSDETEAAKLLERIVKDLVAAIPRNAVGTLTYMDGDELVVRVLTPEDIYN